MMSLHLVYIFKKICKPNGQWVVWFGLQNCKPDNVHPLAIQFVKFLKCKPDGVTSGLQITLYSDKTHALFPYFNKGIFGIQNSMKM